MAISASLIPEFDHEMATTRTVIERVPEDKFGFKPHEKSMTAGRLASHIAEMPNWAVTGITSDQTSPSAARVGAAGAAGAPAGTSALTGHPPAWWLRRSC